MKKLLLALILTAVASSLHSMEPQEQLSPISLAQTYHQFLHSDPALLQDITQQIFSFHLGGVNLAELEQSCKDSEDFVRDIKKLLNSCGYELASELCKHYFSHAKISICDIKYKSSDNTALHYAAFKSKTGIAKLLLNTAGDNVKDFITIQNKRGDTALHYTVCRNSTEIVKLLLNAAGDNVYKLLTRQDVNGETALHCAAIEDRYASENQRVAYKKNYTEIVKLLLNAADENAWTLLIMKNNHDQTALHCAVDYGHIETIKFLLNTAGNNAWTLLIMKDNHGGTALHNAILYGHIETVKLLLNTAGNSAWTLLVMQNKNGETALHNALRSGYLNTVKLLLNTVGDNAQDFITIPAKNGKTAFDIATPEIKEIMQTYLQK